MENSLTNVSGKGEVVESKQLSADQIELIKKTVAKGATDDELAMFLHLSNKYDLDPFAKEIWFIKRVKKVNNGGVWDYPRLANGEIDYSNSEAPIITTSRDGYLKVAQRNPEYEGLIGFPVCEGDTFEIDATNYTVSHKFGAKRGKLIGAWAKCDRQGRKPQISYVDFNEYNDSNSNTWKNYPSAMIQKVAEVFVLKRQFGIDGLVTKEEMPMEFDLKNISDHNGGPEQLPAAGKQDIVLPENVGDYVVHVGKGKSMKLVDMSMGQLMFVKEKSQLETDKAMASAYIDELKYKAEQETEAKHQSEAVHSDNVNTPTTDNQDDTTLFGGQAL